MTAMERIWELSKKIKRLSTNGKLEWERGVEEGVYQVSFPDYTVAVYKRGQYQDQDDYFIQIKDSEGEVLEQVNDNQLAQNIRGVEQTEAFRTLESIFSMARSKALGVDSALSKLMESLDAIDDGSLEEPSSNKTQAPTQTSLDTDDDVPF